MIYKGNSITYDLTNKIAGGGEGDIYEINGNSEKVAKIYKLEYRTAELEKKLKYMQNNAPNPETLTQLAWPLDIIYDNTGFVGFIMNKLDLKDNLEDISVYGDPYLAKVTLKERLIIAQNICAVITDVHNLGYVFGDFNPRNIGINMVTGHVAFFDTDSYHVKTSKDVFRCKVACPEYVAPELLYKIEKEGLSDDAYAKVSLESFTKQTDYFALAIHIFKLINNGYSPFCGVTGGVSQISAAVSTSVATPGLGATAIKNKNYCFANGKKPIAELVLEKSEHPKSISDYFDRVFDFPKNIDYSNNAPSRPTSEEWRIILDDYENNLTSHPCSNGHYYYKKLSKCPYCEADNRFKHKNSQPIKVKPIKQKSFTASPITPMPSMSTQPLASPITTPQVSTNSHQPLTSSARQSIPTNATSKHIKKNKALAVIFVIVGIILGSKLMDKNNTTLPILRPMARESAKSAYNSKNYFEAITNVQKLTFNNNDKELIQKCYNKLSPTTISAGNQFIVGIHEDGTVVAAGNNEYGQCNVQNWNDIVAISAGEDHTIGLRKDGTVVACGKNEDGQCNVSKWTDIVAISAGEKHTIGLKSDGTVISCGSNSKGQCDVSGWTDIIQISAGDLQTVALTKYGTAKITGDDNNNENSKVSDWNNLVYVTTGSEHTIGLKSNGTVVSAGFNSSGAKNIFWWKDMSSIDAGRQRTIGITNDGRAIRVGGYNNGWPITSTEEVATSCVSAAISNTYIILRSDGSVITNLSDNKDVPYIDQNWKNIMMPFYESY